MSCMVAHTCSMPGLGGFLFSPFLLLARRADIVPRAVCVEKLSCDCWDACGDGEGNAAKIVAKKKDQHQCDISTSIRVKFSLSRNLE